MNKLSITQKDADGYRKYPDGELIEILLEHGAQTRDIGPVADLTAQYLKTIGLKVIVKQIDSNLFFTKQDTNEFQTSVMWSHDMGWGSDIGSVTHISPVWNYWFYAQEGEEPPQWIKDIVEIDARKWQAVTGSEEYNRYVEEEFNWVRTNLPFINYVEFVKVPVIINKNLKNIAVDGYDIGAAFSMVQAYYDSP